MSRIQTFMARRAGTIGALAAVVFCGVAAAHAQTASPSSNGSPGRIEFSDANLPPATVEVDLSQGMFKDLFGLGDAAVSGVAESLLQSGHSSEGTQMAAEQLAAARQVMQLAAEVVHEVRVRVYSGLPDQSTQTSSLVSRYDEQLRSGNWETVVQVRDGNQNVRVSLLRSDGAVRGAFIVTADGRDLVLVNAICDISPENVKKLTTAATKIGMENGLQHVIEMKMQKFHRDLPPVQHGPEQAHSDKPL